MAFIILNLTSAMLYSSIDSYLAIILRPNEEHAWLDIPMTQVPLQPFLWTSALRHLSNESTVSPYSQDQG